MENPFLYIVPREDEELINMSVFFQNLEKSIKESLHGGIVISIVGGHGSGKTLILEKMKEKFKKTKIIQFDVGEELIDRVYNLREVNKEVIVILDNIDLLSGREDYLSSLLETLVSKSISGITFVLTCTPNTCKKIERLNKAFANMTIKLEIPSLSFEDAKKMVISRLNEVREKKDTLDPISEENFRHIYDKSYGNPRMILLLLSTLYDTNKGLS